MTSWKRPAPWRIPPRPSWLEGRDTLHEIYDDAPQIMAEGVLVWAYVVMANQDLWIQGNTHDLPAGVTYSLDPYLRIQPEALAPIAERLFAFHEPEYRAPAESPWMRHVQDDLLTGYGRPFHEQVPPEISGRWLVYLSTVMIFPAQLPHGHLDTHVLPLLVGPSGVPLLLPSEHWPTR